MTEPTQPPFLDVPTLLERSQPRGPGLRLWQAAALFVGVVLGSAWLASLGGAMAQIVNALSVIVMLGLIGVMTFISWSTWRRARAEQINIESAEELIRLRRWSEAAILLQGLLSEPMRTPPARIQALIFLTAVLARYNRFDDAITVQNYLLEHAMLDPGTTHGLHLARAMAMLREDHLFDADRAISELRRQVNRAGRAYDDDETTPEPETPKPLSGGLALVEIYRDVKTGHPAEAIELFESALPAMREQLGHRVADAHVLVSRAYDLLGREAEARQQYENATLLSPPVELHRRYPETAVLSQKYQPAAAPKEAA